jgi:hypothetical protein
MYRALESLVCHHLLASVRDLSTDSRQSFQWRNDEINRLHDDSLFLIFPYIEPVRISFFPKGALAASLWEAINLLDYRTFGCVCNFGIQEKQSLGIRFTFILDPKVHFAGPCTSGAYKHHITHAAVFLSPIPTNHTLAKNLNPDPRWSWQMHDTCCTSSA